MSHISPHVRLFRVEDGIETELGKHAQVSDGTELHAVSSVVCYGNRHYSCEVVTGQEVGRPVKIPLDISTGTSRERWDIWHANDVVEFIAGKSANDYARHKSQIEAERRRGVDIERSDGELFRGIFGARAGGRQYKSGGFREEADAEVTANIRQFYTEDGDNLPEPNDVLKFEGESFLVEDIRRDIAVIVFELSRDIGNKE